VIAVPSASRRRLGGADGSLASRYEVLSVAIFASPDARRRQCRRVSYMPNLASTGRSLPGVADAVPDTVKSTIIFIVIVAAAPWSAPVLLLDRQR